MANLSYNSFAKKLLEGGINFTSDTIKIALVTSAYTPNQDTHEFFSSVTNEVVGTGYTAGGATLASKTVNQDNTNNKAYFDAADPSWTTSTITARGAVVYKDTGSAATSPLICYIDFTTDRSSTAATFTVTFDAAGVVAIASA